MRRPILIRSVVVTAATALVVAGCGGGGSSNTSNKDPKAAFSTGLSGLGKTDVLTVTLKFDTTADNLIALSKEDKSGGNVLDAATAKDIANGELVFETKTLNGKNISEHKAGAGNPVAIRFAFNDNGSTYVEIRSRDNTLFAKADVKNLLDLFQQSKAYTELQARANSLPPFVKAFVGGQWVSLDLGVLKSLAGQFGGGAAASPNPAMGDKIVAALKDAITRDSTVARIGTDSQGDHLRLTAQSRALFADLLHSLGTAIPGGELILSKIDTNKIPDHSIVVDAWISNGSLAKLSLDVAQFVPADQKKPGDTLPIVLTFDRSGDDIPAPSGATKVDLSQLGSLLGGLGG